MKKIKYYVFLLVIAFIFNSCNYAENAQSIPMDSISKYYDYFENNYYISLLMNNQNEGEDFSEEQMIAFAISHYSSTNEDYDMQNGVPINSIDDIVRQYFNKEVSNYENNLTVLLDNGNVASRGFSPYPYSYILKEITKNKDGSKTAIFYAVDKTIMENMTEKEYKEKLFAGDFRDFGTVELVEFQFVEKIDVDGDYYLQFFSSQMLGQETGQRDVFHIV